MMSCQGNALSEDAVSYGGFVVESERKRRRICQFDFHHFRIIRNQQIRQQCNSVPDRARIYAVISLHADLNFKFQHYHVVQGESPSRESGCEHHEMSTRIQCLLRITDRQSRSGDRTHRSDFSFFQSFNRYYTLLLFVFGFLWSPVHAHGDSFFCLSLSASTE